MNKQGFNTHELEVRNWLVARGRVLAGSPVFVTVSLDDAGREIGKLMTDASAKAYRDGFLTGFASGTRSVLDERKP